MYFVNEQAFDDFKTWFQQEITTIQAKLDRTCLGLVSDFNQMKLNDLSESFKIRNNATDNTDEFCFARVFIALAMRYFKTTSLAGLMPFDAEELFAPKNIVMLNVERYAHSTPSAIARDLKDIKQAIDITNQVQMISNKKLTRLGQVSRALRKTQSMAASAANAANSQTGRAARTVIRNKIMSKTEYLTAICKILARMKTEMRTMNVYKLTKSSFQKPNRRNPDDYNLQGKIISAKYRPDLHVYLDTSGSVSEKNYEAGIKLCIQLAKKLNVNLYLNSFSHIMSQTWQLNCKDRSLSEIYTKFQNIPKVTGGTEYSKIWRFINASKKRQRELSVMITDFEYSAPSAFIAHPQNLYYMPFANIQWNSVKHCIDYFMKSMLHNDPLIRNKILA
jgi:hypothetical protein